MGRFVGESTAVNWSTVDPTGFSSGILTLIVGSVGDHEVTVNFGFSSL